MAEETFATFMERDRQRHNKKREQIFNQQHELELKLAAVNREAVYFARESCRQRPECGRSRP